MPRKPQKRLRGWTRYPEDPVYSEELLLPSFGRFRVARSDPRTITNPPGGPGDFYLEDPDSSDACSISYFSTKGHPVVADQDFLRLDPGFLRRILLLILNKEEWHTFEFFHKEIKYVRDRDPKAWAGVRISDLRLATDLGRPKDFERELEQVLPSLQLPITKDNVTRWKWETLKEHKENRTKTVRVSFAAAALLLLHDLDMRNIKKTTNHDELVKVIAKVSKLVTALSGRLEDSVNEFSELLAGPKDRSRPQHPKGKQYAALCLYRLGYSRLYIAERVGITTLGPEGKPRSKDWQKRLDESIQGGLEFEREKLPRAADLIARRNDTDVRTRAIDTYREYFHRTEGELETHDIDWIEMGEDLAGGKPPTEHEEIYGAYVQLGSCFVQGIDPVPSPRK